MITPSLGKKQTLWLLRWALILASSYLFLFGTQDLNPSPALALLIAFALCSNLLLYRLPEPWLEKVGFHIALVLFDTLWVSLGAILTQSFSEDFFFLYLLIILLAVVGERLEVIACGAVIIGFMYTGALLLKKPSPPSTPPVYLLRIPFLVAVALFYGYLISRLRQERLRADKARLQEELKTDLISMLSHDLKNPLTAIQGYLGLLLEGSVGPISEAQEKILHGIGANLRQILTLTHNSLDAIRAEDGRLRPQAHPIQLNAIIQETLHQQAYDAKMKGIRLEARLDPHLPLVEADEKQMGRVATNLLHNAIKFTPAGGSIAVATGVENGKVWFSITNTGPGISEAELPHIFDKYQKFSRPGESRGSGLGLYIVKAMVEAHGGEVRVESTPNHRTSFRVCLPLPTKEQGKNGPTPSAF